MVVMTEGWPSRFPLRQVLATLAAVVAAGAAGWLMWLTRRSVGGMPRTSLELQARLDALRVEARELHTAWSRGDLLRSEYERRRAWIAEQMATTLRRLREAGGVDSTMQDRASASSGVDAGADAPGAGAPDSADDSAADRD
jgi:hypothetical protein